MDQSDAPFQQMADEPERHRTSSSIPSTGDAFGCCRKRVEDTHRMAYVNDAALNPYGNNFISTSKYTLISFVPRSLFEQFRRIANVYFLGISILMLIGTYFPKVFESPLSAYSTLGPLCLVLFITMVKEGAEDYKRHKSDREVNNRLAPVLQADGTELSVLWKELRVGMVVKIANKGEVPADLIVLQTSEPKSVCYVETSNIDGETNLKLKEAVTSIAAANPTADHIARLNGHIVYEPPNDRIYAFTGKIKTGSEEYVPVGARNMVLRGCTLRNTHWMLGLIVYTGRDTKVMKKNSGVRSKMSQVEKMMNTCIKVIFLAQFILCTFTTIALVIWNSQLSGQYPYLYLTSATLWIPNWLGDWFTFLILFNNFIPISLYVTVEMVNYAQALLVDIDPDMFDPESKTPAKARTSNLNQDLGQIEYVFSDKTGTLTRNVMEFKQCSVAGQVFGNYTPESAVGNDDEVDALDRPADPPKKVSGMWDTLYTFLTGNTNKAQQSAAQAVGATGAAIPGAMELGPSSFGADNPMSSHGGRNYSGNGSSDVKQPVASGSGFSDDALFAVLRHGSGTPGYGAGWLPQRASTPVERAVLPSKSSHTQADTAANGTPPQTLSQAQITALEAFFACMAVCHTVVPEAAEDGGPPIYQAESPDEGALSKAAREVGFEFLQRDVDSIVVRRANAECSVDLRFAIHGVHEFNSTRKRMSVVATMPDCRYVLMCKGADNVIFDRSYKEPTRATLEHDLTKFASAGLRTLVLAQRELTEDEFAKWKAEYHSASVSIERREEMLADVAEKYEVNLSVLGATAIEDRLQQGVPGTIRDLARAGIKTWVLTGDKVETAINIGFSARLLEPSMEMIQIVSDSPDVIRAQLAVLEDKFLPLVNDPISFLDRLLRRKRVRSRTKSTGIPVRVAGPGAPSGSVLTHHLPAKVSMAGSVQADSVATSPASRGSSMLEGFPHDMLSTPNGSFASGTDSALPMARQESIKVTTNMAVIVTGQALTHIIGIKDLEQAFLTVARCCRSVIACRVSPQQKAALVRLVRRNLRPRPMTLAIGDGANDVGMIQRAQVGVGISGKEGLQAVNSADFAIAQFRFLRRLLLVHGRWDYRRMTKVVLYSFYKNVVITLSLFYFTALTGFSGTSFYESLVYSSYNFVLGLPIIFIGILDRDVSAKSALAHPSVYAVGLLNMDLNVRKMLNWIFKAVLHSAIVFWIPYGVFAQSSVIWDYQNGYADGMAVAGLATFSALIWGMQFKVCTETFTWTNLNIFFLVISMAGYYAFTGVYQWMFSVSPEFYGVASITYSRPAYWFAILLVVGTMAIIEYSLEYVRLQLWPRPTDIAIEIDRGYGGPNVSWGDEDVSAPAPAPLSLDNVTPALAPAASFSLPDKHTPSKPNNFHSSSVAPGPETSVVTGPQLQLQTDSKPVDATRSPNYSRDRKPQEHRPPVYSARATPGTILPEDKLPSVPRPVPQPERTADHIAPPGGRASRHADSRALGGNQYFNSSGIIHIPREAILEGTDAAARQTMGLHDANKRSGFDYSHIAGKTLKDPSSPVVRREHSAHSAAISATAQGRGERAKHSSPSDSSDSDSDV